MPRGLLDVDCGVSVGLDLCGLVFEVHDEVS